MHIHTGVKSMCFRAGQFSIDRVVCVWVLPCFGLLPPTQSPASLFVTCTRQDMYVTTDRPGVKAIIKVSWVGRDRRTHHLHGPLNACVCVHGLFNRCLCAHVAALVINGYPKVMTFLACFYCRVSYFPPEFSWRWPWGFTIVDTNMCIRVGMWTDCVMSTSSCIPQNNSNDFFSADDWDLGQIR
jgi:hypothetical protein